MLSGGNITQTRQLRVGWQGAGRGWGPAVGVGERSDVASLAEPRPVQLSASNCRRPRVCESGRRSWGGGAFCGFPVEPGENHLLIASTVFPIAVRFQRHHGAPRSCRCPPPGHEGPCRCHGGREKSSQSVGQAGRALFAKKIRESLRRQGECMPMPG